MSRIDLYTKLTLTAIAVFLGVLALRPAADPPTVAAQSNPPYLYVEPSTTPLRNLDGTIDTQGKVVIDLRNGDVWGFPTLSLAPYPVDVTKSTPPVSKPIYLGRFDFSAMKR